MLPTSEHMPVKMMASLSTGEPLPLTVEHIRARDSDPLKSTQHTHRLQQQWQHTLDTLSSGTHVPPRHRRIALAQQCQDSVSQAMQSSIPTTVSRRPRFRASPSSIILHRQVQCLHAPGNRGHHLHPKCSTKRPQRASLAEVRHQSRDEVPDSRRRKEMERHTRASKSSDETRVALRYTVAARRASSHGLARSVCQLPLDRRCKGSGIAVVIALGTPSGNDATTICLGSECIMYSDLV